MCDSGLVVKAQHGNDWEAKVGRSYVQDLLGLQYEFKAIWATWLDR